MFIKGGEWRVGGNNGQHCKDNHDDTASRFGFHELTDTAWHDVSACGCWLIRYVHGVWFSALLYFCVIVMDLGALINLQSWRLTCWEIEFALNSAPDRANANRFWANRFWYSNIKKLIQDKSF